MHMKYEIKLPDLHEIAGHEIKKDFIESIIENRAKTRKIIEDQGISVLAFLRWMNKKRDHSQSMRSSESF